MSRVSLLVDQIESWAKDAGWKADRPTELAAQSYSPSRPPPALVVRMRRGEVHVRPVPFDDTATRGRVDLEGYPPMNRVSLLWRRGTWEIMTASNVPLRAPWAPGTFVQLAKDLVA
jgi:hypothetical protein